MLIEIKEDHWINPDLIEAVVSESGETAVRLRGGFSIKLRNRSAGSVVAEIAEKMTLLPVAPPREADAPLSARSGTWSAT